MYLQNAATLNTKNEYVSIWERRPLHRLLLNFCTNLNPLRFTVDYSRPVPIFFTLHSKQMDCCSSWTRRSLNRSSKRTDVAWSSSYRTVSRVKLDVCLDVFHTRHSLFQHLRPSLLLAGGHLTSDSINWSHWCVCTCAQKCICNWGVGSVRLCVPDSFVHLCVWWGTVHSSSPKAHLV